MRGSRAQVVEHAAQQPCAGVRGRSEASGTSRVLSKLPQVRLDLGPSGLADRRWQSPGVNARPPAHERLDRRQQCSGNRCHLRHLRPSCTSQPPLRARRASGARLGSRGEDHGLGLGRQRVQTAAGAILARRNLGCFPAAFEQAHLLEPVERAVQRAVRGQQAMVGEIAQTFWAMLENAADHADFIDFVRRFTRERPFSRTTTELLFLLDELAQGSRDVLLMVLGTNPEQDLRYTAAVNRDGHDLAIDLQRHYAGKLWDRQLGSPAAIQAHYDNLRLRLLSTIADATPGGYRAGDARFLAGEIAFQRGLREDAERWWREIVPDRRDTYVAAYTRILDALDTPGGSSRDALRDILRAEVGRWRMASVDRLRQFGSGCDRF